MSILVMFSQENTSDLKNMINETRKLKELIQSDPHRPIYHFVAPEGHAMPFDPNGAIYWKGKYHLGYIYQKLRNGKYEHVWGHNVSTDLLHWTQYPDMLDIKDGDIEKGIFSGGAFLSKEGIPHIMYHGEGSSTNLVAFSTDKDLKVWQKFKGNPVLKTPVSPDSMAGKYNAWDPEGWYDKTANSYYMISGGIPSGLFKSPDMLKWKYLGDLIDHSQRKQKEFEDISCPDFFNIGNKQMLLFIGHYLGTQYYIGNFKDDKFTAEKYGRMNWPGGTFFAPEQLVDDKGRNIIWGWVLERKPQQLKDYGWSGIMSLPRELSLGKNEELLINPPSEIKSLRLGLTNDKNIKLEPNTEKTLTVKGKTLEIELEMIGGLTTSYGVKVFCSPDGREETTIKYDPIAKEIVINFIKSNVNSPVKMEDYCLDYKGPKDKPKGTVTEQRAPFELKKGETLKLNIFIDKSIIEVFANGRQCITQVVYPELAESDNVKVFSENGNIQVKGIKAWKMADTNAF